MRTKNITIIIIIIIIIIIQNFIHRFKKIDYLQIQEYEILKYIPYVHSSCVRKRIVVKWLSKDYYWLLLIINKNDTKLYS